MLQLFNMATVMRKSYWPWEDKHCFSYANSQEENSIKAYYIIKEDLVCNN